MAGFRRNISSNANKKGRRVPVLLLALAIFLPLTAVPGAHGQNKKKKNQSSEKVNNDSANPIVPLTDEQQIDYMLSEYLGAWQLGDTDRMHKDYSDDVSVVTGGWAAPVVGWANYLKLYQQQRSHMQQVRMDRMNTYIKVSGTTAWTCYQWEFQAVVDGTPTGARGQTTLVLVKKENRWLIVHDHTSVVSTSKQGQPAAPGAAPANTPPPESKTPS